MDKVRIIRQRISGGVIIFFRCVNAIKFLTNLTRLILASHKWDIVKERRLDETQHNVASHQGLNCLLKRKSIYVKLMKKKNQPDNPIMKDGLF